MGLLRACFSIRGVLVPAFLSVLFAAPAAQAQSDVRQAVPPAGKALVYVFRHDRAALPGQVPAVVNAERLGTLVNGSFVTATVNPGQTNVRIGDRLLTTIDFTARANQRYFVHVNASYGTTNLRTEVQLVSEQEGLRALEQSRYVGSAAPVVAAAPRPAPPTPTPPPAPSVAPAPAPRAAAPAPVVTPAAPPSARVAPPPPAVTRVAPAPPPAPPPAPRQAPAVTEVAAGTAPARTSEITLIVSTGTFKLSNESQVVGGPPPSSYDTASKSVLNVQLEWRSKTGLAIGGEVFSYTNDLSTSGGQPDAKQATLATLANAKYYFQTSGRARPFVGAGLGFTSNSYSGNLTGTTTGLAYQGLVGVEFRFNNNIGLHLQYKHLASTAGADEKVKVGGSGLLVGLGFNF